MKLFRVFIFLLSVSLVISGCAQMTPWDRQYDITMSHATKRCEGKQDTVSCIADIEREAALARDVQKDQNDARANSYIWGVVMGALMAGIGIIVITNQNDDSEN